MLASGVGRETRRLTHGRGTAVKAGLAASAVAALIVLAGLSGSAAAHLFTWTGALGKLVLFTGEGVQLFTFDVGSVECASVKLETVTGWP